MDHTVSMLPVALVATLEQVTNAALALDPELRDRLRTMEGQVLGVEVIGLGIRLYLIPTHDRLRLLDRFDGAADAMVRGSPLSLLRLNASANAERLFGGEVVVEGDPEVARQFQAVFARMDVDWEEHLSRITGDVIAHQIGTGVRGFLDWGRQAAATLGRDVAEYLQEERRTLPNREEVERLLSAVDELRIDSDRLEARIRRLDQRMGKAGD